jgi:hypothetical protein
MGVVMSKSEKLQFIRGGVRLPTSKCVASESGAHHWITYRDQVFQCKYCFILRWLPVYFDDATRYGQQVSRWGEHMAYSHAVRNRPEVEKIIREYESGNVR